MPLAAVATGGTSLAPFKVALNITGGGGVEAQPAAASITADQVSANRRRLFIGRSFGS